MDKRIKLCFLIPFFLFWHWFEPVAKKNLNGLKAFHDGNYETALQAFLSAKGNKPDLAALKNNTAATLYELKKFQEAKEEFSSIDLETSKLEQSNHFYNMGNTNYRLEDYKQALEDYKKSLMLDPADINAKKNYELTLKKLEEQQKDKQDPDQEKQQDDKKDQQPQKQKEQEREQKYKNIMQYLNQNEKAQLEKRKRKVGIAKKEKDW